jgi:hypothetical protein
MVVPAALLALPLGRCHAGNVSEMIEDFMTFREWEGKSLLGHVAFYEGIIALPWLVWFLASNNMQGTLAVSFTLQFAVEVIAGSALVAFAIWHTATLPIMKRANVALPVVVELTRLCVDQHSRVYAEFGTMRSNVGGPRTRAYNVGAELSIVRALRGKPAGDREL